MFGGHGFTSGDPAFIAYTFLDAFFLSSWQIWLYFLLLFLHFLFILERQPEPGYLTSTNVFEVPGVKLPDRLDPSSQFFR